VEEWTQICWLEPNDAPLKAELETALESFLSSHGISRDSIADDDVRLDVAYLGPANGHCARRLMIRTATMHRS
jgi:hypothetical protein